MREVIKKDRVWNAAANRQALDSGRGTREPPPACQAQPRVRLFHLHEGAQALEVTCRCGEVSLVEIELERETAS